MRCSPSSSTSPTAQIIGTINNRMNINVISDYASCWTTGVVFRWQILDIWNLVDDLKSAKWSLAFKHNWCLSDIWRKSWACAVYSSNFFLHLWYWERVFVVIYRLADITSRSSSSILWTVMHTGMRSCRWGRERRQPPFGRFSNSWHLFISVQLRKRRKVKRFLIYVCERVSNVSFRFHIVVDVRVVRSFSEDFCVDSTRIRI